MAFARIVAGWLLVVVLFLLWQKLGARRTPAAEADGGVKAALPSLLLEALLLTLFAGLWFGSLGSGGGYILFPLLGALIELPGRVRRTRGTPFPWLASLSGILRIAIPGILLGFILV
jgi:uncharacterized membrane protein YfcA